MPDLMGIGVSGLLAYQSALNTTGHNISNVNTDGYSRQSVDLATRPATMAGNGYFGQGVDATGVSREYDSFLSDQVRTHNALSNRADSYYNLSSQIDNLLADTNAGLAPALQDFFASVQGVADNPSSTPTRQVMVTSGQTLSDRFNYIDQRFTDLQTQAEGELSTTVGDINDLASAIAAMNSDIVRAQAVNGSPPNDMLDKRDNLIDELAQKVKVTTMEQSDGSVNIFIGNGQGMVVGANSASLSITNNEYGTGKDILLTSGSGSVDVTNLLTGGSIGGTLSFISDNLEPARRIFGRIATSVAESFNAQNQLGLDLNGDVGGDFFSAPSPEVDASDNNTATGSPTVGVSDISSLTTDNYILSYDGSNWSLKDAQTSQTVTPSSGSGTNADPWIVDGMSISTDGISGAVAGDKFLIQPVETAGGGIGTSLTDPTQVAAAGPFSIGQATDANGLPTNSGSGTISDLSVAAVSGASGNLIPMGGSATLTYDSAAKQFTIGGLPAGVTATPSGGVAGDPISYDPATDKGSSYTVTLSDGTNSIDVTFKLDGTPSNGDQFTIADNSGNVTDNRNALVLNALETAKTMIGGTTSFQSSYGQLVADVGAKTHQADVNNQAETTLLQQATAAKEAVSGVNLDEEAANLIKFQQAYQASSQVVLAAKNTFQILMQAVG